MRLLRSATIASEILLNGPSTENPSWSKESRNAIATSASSSTTMTRLPATVIGLDDGSAGVSGDAFPLRPLIGAMSSRGTDRMHCSPSGRQSNTVWPASWPSMLAVMIRVPKPGDDGACVAGPPLSVHFSTSVPGLSSHARCTRPDREDSAPYLAALVTSSCSASASDCAAAGCSDTFGPDVSTLAVSPVRYGASS